MKQLSKKRWLEREWNRSLRPGETTLDYYRDGRTTRQRFSGTATAAPAILSLRNNFDETAEFLQEIRSNLTASLQKMNLNRRHRRRRPSESFLVRKYWDFSNIESISPPVALIVASEYDRVRRFSNWVPGAINFWQWKPSVRDHLRAIGFLRLTKIEDDDEEVVSGDGWKMLRLRSGSNANGPEVGKLLQDLALIDVLPGEVYGAIVEALTNTHEHAYPQDLQDPFRVKDWWMTGYINTDQREVQIIVFDQGETIPGTIAGWDRYPIFVRRWKQLFASDPDPADFSRDGQCLRLAMAIGRSRTGESKRGKGLHAMEEAINLCEDGELVIYSRRGEYRKSAGAKPIYRTRNVPVSGTLILWRARYRGSNEHACH